MKNPCSYFMSLLDTTEPSGNKTYPLMVLNSYNLPGCRPRGAFLLFDPGDVASDSRVGRHLTRSFRAIEVRVAGLTAAQWS